jgi:hypothetical protein
MSVGSDIVAAVTAMAPADKYDPAKVWDVIVPILTSGAQTSYTYTSGLRGLDFLAAWHEGSASAGTIRIKLPSAKRWSSTNCLFIINIFDSVNGPSTFLVSGYNGGSAWTVGFARMTGLCVATQVRLGDDGSNNLILLGAVGNTWNYPKIEVYHALLQNAETGWLTGWDISRITSEAGITVNQTMSVLHAGYAVYAP